MKKKIAKVIIIIIIIGCALFIVLKNTKSTSKNTEFDEIYIIETDDQFKKIKDDGESYYDRKYVIDFKNKKVLKKEDFYEEFVGEKYKDKELYKKSLTKKEIIELKKIIKEVINNYNNNVLNPQDASNYYVLSCKSYSEIKIYDIDLINRIEKLVKYR